MLDFMWFVYFVIFVELYKSYTPICSSILNKKIEYLLLLLTTQKQLYSLLRLNHQI